MALMRLASLSSLVPVLALLGAGCGNKCDELVSTLAIPTGANAPCVQSDVVGITWDDAATVTNDALYYLVRAGNACGEGSWGSDSLGTPRPTCP